jgi:hypothetical protein
MIVCDTAMTVLAELRVIDAQILPHRHITIGEIPNWFVDSSLRSSACLACTGRRSWWSARMRARGAMPSQAGDPIGIDRLFRQ